MHKIQRVPPTESKGRRHTSIINVLLLDSLEEVEINIDWNRVVVSYYKDSGAGGQHRNKTMSGTRLQYDGITVECCETRDQRKNKEIAKERLFEKLKKIEFKRVREISKNQIDSQNQNKGNRGGCLRNYDFMRGIVEQNESKITIKDFMKGRLEALK